MLHHGIEPEPGQDATGTGRGGTGADLVEPRLDFGDAQRLRAPVEFAQQGGALPVGGKNRRERGGIAGRRLLREKPDAPAARHDNVAGVRKQAAADQVEQRRLAGAVAADETELAAVGDLRVGLIEQRPSMTAADTGLFPLTRKWPTKRMVS